MSQGIYRIDINGECLYVGQSCELEKRKAMHKWMLENNRHSNRHLQNIYNKHRDGFKFSVVETVDDHAVLTDREKHWVAELSPRCNMLVPADNGMWNPTQDVRDKISKAHKGKKRTISDVGMANIIAAHKGKSMSEAQKKALSDARKGIRMPDSNPQVKHKTPTKEWLEENLARVGGGSNLANELGYNKRVVKRWCENLGVPFYAKDWGKPTYETPTKTKLVGALIYHGYHDAAKIFGVSPNVVKRWCTEYGLPYKKVDWMEVGICSPVRTC